MVPDAMASAPSHEDLNEAEQPDCRESFRLILERGLPACRFCADSRCARAIATASAKCHLQSQDASSDFAFVRHSVLEIA